MYCCLSKYPARRLAKQKQIRDKYLSFIRRLDKFPLLDHEHKKLVQFRTKCTDTYEDASDIDRIRIESELEVDITHLQFLFNQYQRYSRHRILTKNANILSDADNLVIDNNISQQLRDKIH